MLLPLPGGDAPRFSPPLRVPMGAVDAGGRAGDVSAAVAEMRAAADLAPQPPRRPKLLSICFAGRPRDDF